MPKRYSRDCDHCGQPYEGYGSRYCSNECTGAAKRGDNYNPVSKTGVTVRETKDGATAESGKQGRIKSLDDLLAAASVDLDTWEVERYVLNKWEVGSANPETEEILVEPLFQVKAWLKRRVWLVEMQQIRERILEDIRAATTHAPVDFRWPQGDHLKELDFMDLHVGKLGWAPEVGEDFDTDILERRVDYAVEELFQKSAGFKIGRITIPTGNDLSQIDGNESATTSGTRVDTDSRYARILQRAVRIKRKMIDRALEVGPVEVPIVPGNHDYQTSIAIGHILAAVYEGNPHVTVDASPNPRKYVEWGQCAILFTHGNNEKPQSLPLIFAAERKELWARTTFREAHIGHFHGKKEWHFLPLWEENGVRVRVIPSLCGPDAWHHMKGFVKNIKTAQSFLWDKKSGLSGYFDSNVTRHEA